MVTIRVSLNIDLPHRSNKSVSLPWNRLDQGVAVRVAPQGLAQNTDILAQVALFHEALRPEGLHHFFFFYELSAVLEEKQKGVENLGRKNDLAAVAGQGPLFFV